MQGVGKLRSLALRLIAGASLLATVLTAASILLVAARPLATDDTWWHLAHGAAYATEGPWLDADPLLFTAPGPPMPASWLADLALHGTLRGFGFVGLRVLHASLVGSILVGVFLLARRVSRSTQAAACVTISFAVLAAYRLIQLRPELFTILAALVLARWLLEPTPITRARCAAVAFLCGVWSNLHAGFLLGPTFLGVALSSVVAASLFQGGEARARSRARARGFAQALVAGVLGSLVNPAGLGAYAPLLRAGRETPALGRVADEWARADWLSWPVDAMPSGVIGWWTVWALWLAVAWVTLRGRARSKASRRATDVDPVLVGLALACAAAMAWVIRLLWLGVFPALLVAAATRELGPRAWRRSASAALTIALVAGFLGWGDGRRLRGELPASTAEFARPFHAARYFAHATWLLQDAAVEGRLYTDYFLGGFNGYWLAPRVRSFSNGSLNVRPDAMAANLALRTGRGQRQGESFLALLDRFEIDLYLGTRLPEVGPPGRPFFCTTAHLESAEGWLLVFRNLRSALYLRDVPRNQASLARLVAFYEARGVPFDRATGFDVARVIREAPGFAVAHGVVPRSFGALVASLRAPNALERDGAADRLASIYAVLGLYAEALELDRDRILHSPTPRRRRRLVWLLLRSGRAEEALAFVADASSLQAAPWDALARAVQAAGGLPPAEVAAGSTNLPFLTRREAQLVLSGFVHPAPRAPRG